MDILSFTVVIQGNTGTPKNLVEGTHARKDSCFSLSIMGLSAEDQRPLLIFQGRLRIPQLA